MGVSLIDFLFAGDTLFEILESKSDLFGQSLRFIVVGDPLTEILDLAYLSLRTIAIFPKGGISGA